MNFTKPKIVTVFLTGLSLAMPATVFAGADSGFYIGAGAGDATVKDSNFDASDTAYKIFGGYNIGFIPLVDFAVEASYVDFGAPSTSLGNIDVTGLNAYGLAGLSFGPFGVFAKAGMLNWDSDATFGSVSTSDSGQDLLLVLSRCVQNTNIMMFRTALIWYRSVAFLLFNRCSITDKQWLSGQ